MNYHCVMGRLTADPELKTTSSGIAVTTYTVAVDRGYGEKKTTDFIPCVAWKKTAEFIRDYFIKGDMICTEGTMQSRSWEDKHGNKRISWEHVVDRAHFCGKATENNADNGDNVVDNAVDNDDDLPF